MKKEELQAKLIEAQKQVAAIEAEIEVFETAPENNVFASVEEASRVLEERLEDKARNDCEGSYNCGDEEYTQEFIVDGAHYIAKLEVEYNRHDKTYYYVDGSKFSVSAKT